ncbi:MAG: bile acid:sodium symporter family protein [Saprospiraceae bacterium]
MIDKISYFAYLMHEVDQLVVNFSSDTALILNVSLGIIMFSVALGLTIDDFIRVLSSPKPILLGLFSQFFLLPLLTYFIVVAINPIPSLALGMFMIAACPGGNVSNFMSSIANANVALSVSLSAVATALAIFITPINFAFWSGLYAPTSGLMEEINVSLVQMIRTVFIIMGIPLILGMWFRKRYYKLTLRIERPIRIISLLIFGIIVVSAIYMNFDAFWTNLYYVLFLVLGHNFLALLTGYTVGKGFQLPWKDIKSLSIETGIQNSGLGLLLIFTFFNGLGGMALVAAWWGIWHIISGLSLSYYWKFRV